MKTMKLVDRIRKLLRRQYREMPVKKLRKTLKALRQKQEYLEGRLKRTRRKRLRRKLQQKIELLRMERARGAETYRRLVALRKP